MRRSPRAAFCILFILLTTSLIARAADEANWPRFRGPTGDGVTPEKNLPTKWSATDGILWKADLPNAHHPYSSPIVWKDKVFIATAGDTALTQKLICFNAADGKQLWETAIAPGPTPTIDMRGGFNCTTPCTDGERVYVTFGSCVLAAVDMDGKEAWHADLVGAKFDVSAGASPVVYKDLIIQSCEAPSASSLMAFDRKTGELKYKEPRPAGYAHSTPVIMHIDPANPWLAISSPNGLYGLNPETGKDIWSIKQPGDVASPIYGDGVIFCDSGRGGPGTGVAVDAASKGDIATSLKWKTERLKGTMSSAVISGEYLYRVTEDSKVHCISMADGKSLYAEKLPGIATWASPLATADGLIYVASGAKSYVIKAGPKYELISTNDLGDPGQASPAVLGGRIYIRGGTKLWCVGK